MKTFVNQEIYGESINVDTINQLIYSLYTLLKKYSEKHYTSIYYGYYDAKKFEMLFYDAYDYLVNLIAQRERIQLESCCVCYEELGKCMELVRQLVGTCSPLRIDLIEDNAGYDDWVLANPDRVAREVWEVCLYAKCSPVTFNLVRVLNKEGKDCKLVYQLVQSIQDCNLSYSVVNNSRNCQPEYELLMKTVKNCKITYDDFVVIHSCGITVDTINDSHNCGATIEVDRKDKCINLVYNLTKYQLNCYE